MSWWRGSIVVAVGAAVLAAGAWWGLAREDGDDDRVEARPRPIALDVGEILDLVPGCRRDLCRIADRRDGFRHEGERVAMVVVVGPGACGSLPEARIHLVTARGPTWSGPAGVVCGDPARGIDTDATGHAFLGFPTEGGRTKLVVLDVGGGTVDDHGSFEGRFEGDRVTAADQDGDDVYEIVVDGEVHRWNGREYREPA
ncbi:MAG TPA: hypothetical protein VM618_11810 [Acidimicrobiia bacterium]|nr:hypothetical protein [Acidimicrobiia bacterium]